MYWWEDPKNQNKPNVEMAKREHEQDQRDWLKAIDKALAKKDYVKLNELIKDGIYYEYELPRFDDPKACELLDSYLN